MKGVISIYQNMGKWKMVFLMLIVSLKNSLKRDKRKKEIFLKEWIRRRNWIKIIKMLKKEWKRKNRNNDYNSKSNSLKNWLIISLMIKLNK